MLGAVALVPHAVERNERSAKYHVEAPCGVNAEKGIIDLPESA